MIACCRNFVVSICTAIMFQPVLMASSRCKICWHQLKSVPILHQKQKEASKQTFENAESICPRLFIYQNHPTVNPKVIPHFSCDHFAPLKRYVSLIFPWSLGLESTFQMGPYIPGINQVISHINMVITPVIH